MAEHEIATWKKLDGTWEVTHKHDFGGTKRYLYDDPADFKAKFRNREAADEYALGLFKRYKRKGSRVSLYSPDVFGQEVKGGWTSPRVKSKALVAEDGKITLKRWDFTKDERRILKLKEIA